MTMSRPSPQNPEDWDAWGALFKLVREHHRPTLFSNIAKVTDALWDAGYRRPLPVVENVAYAAWNSLDGFPPCPYDGRTREGLAWNAGARQVFKAVSELVGPKDA